MQARYLGLASPLRCRIALSTRHRMAFHGAAYVWTIDDPPASIGGFAVPAQLQFCTNMQCPIIFAESRSKSVPVCHPAANCVCPWRRWHLCASSGWALEYKGLVPRNRAPVPSSSSVLLFCAWGEPPLELKTVSRFLLIFCCILNVAPLVIPLALPCAGQQWLILFPSAQAYSA